MATFRHISLQPNNWLSLGRGYRVSNALGMDCAFTNTIEISATVEGKQDPSYHRT
jgi:hypothetical protein